MMETGYSLADIAAATGNSGGNNNDGFGGNGSGWWIILLFLALAGRGYGFGGGNDGGSGGGQGYSQPIVIDAGRSGGSCGCGCSPCATVADLAAGFNNSAVLGNLNDLALGQAAIQQTLCQGFNGVNTTVLQGFNGVGNAICNLGYNVQAGFNGISREIADCCCDLRAGLADVKYQNAANTCALQNTIQNTTRDIIDNANANSRAVLDFLVKDKIDTLQSENLALRFRASQSEQNAFISANQQAQTAELIRRLGADCPVNAVVVQPNTPVTFPTNCCGQVNYAGYNNGCGCNNGCGGY